MKSLSEDEKEFLKKIEDWSKNNYFVINGNRYELHNITHIFRTEVLALYSRIESKLLVGNYSFINDVEFKNIMKKVDDKITFENSTISKIGNHFEDHPEDYIDYVGLSLKVIVYPFYKTKLNTN